MNKQHKANEFYVKAIRGGYFGVYGGFGESCVRASNEAEAYKKLLKNWRKYGLYEPMDAKPICVK